MNKAKRRFEQHSFSFHDLPAPDLTGSYFGSLSYEVSIPEQGNGTPSWLLEEPTKRPDWSSLKLEKLSPEGQALSLTKEEKEKAKALIIQKLEEEET